jgi:hypothetical protein
MPYKDPQRKREWERINRLKRLARRRELRYEKVAQELTATKSADSMTVAGYPWLLFAGGGLMLALYRPELGLGAGGLILTVAAVLKKGWQWWILGAVIIALALFVLASDQRNDTTNMIPAKK